MNKTPETLSRRDGAELLRWYEACGVDACLEESAIDRLSAPPPAPPSRVSEVRESPRSTAPQNATVAAPPPSPMAADSSDGSPATAAATLEELRSALESFDGCGLREGATNLVFSDGNPQSRVMIIGEAPGRDEDLQGLPFVGRSGRLLDRMLAAVGMDRTSVYITNVLPWRPPMNRNPTLEESAAFRPFLDRHIELASPDILFLLGNVANKTLLETTQGIMKLRGNWTEYRITDRTWPVLPSFHPAYLLRQPAQKRLAWRDLQSLRAWLAEHPAGGESK